MLNVRIRIRGAGVFITQIDEANTVESLGSRFVNGGWVLAEDERWHKKQKILINAKDIVYVIFEENN